MSHGLSELEQIRREGLSDIPLNPQQADQKNLQDINERILTDLSQFFRDKNNTSPMIWVIDDAHFSTADPNVTDLLTAVIRAAQRNRWPILIIVTHWEKEWYEHLSDKAQPSTARAIKEN